MQIVLMALTLAFSPVLFGNQDFSPLIRKIGISLQTLNEDKSCAYLNSPAPQFQIFEDTATHPELKDECLKQICSATGADKYATQDSPFNPVNADNEKRMMGVKAALKDLINAEASLDLRHKKWTDSFKKSPIKIDDKFGLSMIKVLAKPGVETLTKITSNGQPPNENIKAALAKSYSTLGSSSSAALVDVIVKLTQDPRIAVTGANHLGAPFRYKKQFPNLNYQEAVKKDLEETKKALADAPAEVKEIIHMAALDKELENEISSLSSDKMVDEIKGQNIFKITDQIHSIIAVQKHSGHDSALGKKLAAIIFSPERLAKSEKKPPSISALPDGIEKKTLPELYASFKKGPSSAGIYQNCLFNFSYSAITLPTKKNIEDFKRNLPAMRSKIIQSLKGRYSHVSGEILGKMIQDISIYTPPEKEAYTAEVENQLRARTERINSIIKQGDQSVENAGIIEAIGDRFTATPEQEILDVCNQLTFHPVRDNTVAALGGIAVGSDSVKNESFGLGIIAHEIGHNVQATMSSDSRISGESRAKQKKVEECLINLHKPFFTNLDKFNEGKAPEFKDPRTPTHFLNEDFSDLVGAQVSAKSNFYCQVGSIGLGWGPTSGDLDSHSSALFRVLHVEIASGRKLPNACQQFLTLNKYELKNCFE